MSSILIGTFSSMVSLSVILLIAAQGEAFVEKSGQFNMGIEGIMISAALCAFAATYFSGSTVVGVFVGGISGALLGALKFWLIERIHISAVLVGIVFNLLAGGVTGFLAEVYVNGNSAPLRCGKIESISIPVLSQIPYIGKILFRQNLIVYLAFLAIPFIYYYLFHTKGGLYIRAVGEDETAAQTMGIHVMRVKLKCFVIGGITAGISGAYCSLTLGLFMDNMTENKGFIAMALCAFSRQNPVGIFLGALFFALVDSIQIRLQLFHSGIPYEFMVCLPYVMTIVAVLFTSDRFRLDNLKRKKKTVNRMEKDEEEPEYFI